jgi:histidine ammonia-lyase
MKAAVSIELGERPWTIEDIVHIAIQGNPVSLTDNETWHQKMAKSSAYLQRLWESHEKVYGVTTGYGASCEVEIPPALLKELPLHLTRFHGCGMGAVFTPEAARAIVAARLASLSTGLSGIRLEVLEALTLLLNNGVAPVIPEEGSVGASGDLTPLSYVAAMLLGERDVFHDGERKPALEGLAAAGLDALTLLPKEALALMNGTSVMTGLAALAYSRAEYLARISARITAMAVESMCGNRTHYTDRLFAAKPHPGQREVARWIYNDLHEEHAQIETYPVQDRYSLRCAPHIIGVLTDALPWMRSTIEIELNGANDNPLIDGEHEEILHGGHFYGGHIAFAMDGMKNAVANLADLLDRQVALLTDKHVNNGLPANLSGASDERAAINHGFKAVQISISAWTAEALKLTMPASVFSRSTECHNQDKVSMGTISARDSLRVLELTEQVAAASMLVAAQGIQLRLRRGEIKENMLKPQILDFCNSVAEISPFLDEDRPLEHELRSLVAHIQQQHWNF